MKINTTKAILYFCAVLNLLGLFILTYCLYQLVNWIDFFSAASRFLPVAAGLLIAALLLFLGLYLAIKAANHRKEKKHVRYL